MEIRPIRNEADYKATLAEIEKLMDAKFGSRAGDRLDVLATLVEAYEAQQCPVAPPDPITAVLFMMEQKQLTRRDLEQAIGGRARVADVLNRRRPLTLPMIRALGPLLDLPADLLVQPYPTKRRTRQAEAASQAA